MKFRISSLIRLSLIVSAWMILIQGTSSAAATCTHYASPTGNGIGTSAAQPFKIANFWPLAKPGYTLCLMDGKYTGSASMINPPQNLSGTASAPITVRALNDGKVTINGQGSYTPVRLYKNHYFVLEGFNARDSKNSVVAIEGSSHNIVRRVAAWDATDNNNNIFGIHGGSHNLLEDVAGWGIARKTFSASQGGDHTTIRRAWGRWEGSHVVGPKMTYTLAYKNYNMTCENCIGTWSGERIKTNYKLLDYYGKPWTGKGAGTYADYEVDQPYGIFSNDGLGTDKNARSKLLGSIAYVRGSDRFAPGQVIFVTKVDSLEVANTVVYVEPRSHTSTKTFSLNKLASAVGTNLIARNLTGIGGAGSYINPEWEKTSISGGSSTSSVDNVFSGKSGANICYRYKDRSLTTEPLWPWPMNQRIKDATIESGRASVDVTKTIESMFGPIPSVCTASGSVASGSPSTGSPSTGTGPSTGPTVAIPKTPVNLVVNP
jgi:hypothetical protein